MNWTISSTFNPSSYIHTHCSRKWIVHNVMLAYPHPPALFRSFLAEGGRHTPVASSQLLDDVTGFTFVGFVDLDLAFTWGVEVLADDFFFFFFFFLPSLSSLLMLCSTLASSHFSASMAAWQPLPAAVIACLYLVSTTSPQAKIPIQTRNEKKINIHYVWAYIIILEYGHLPH